jgi:hypothetical protein
MPSKFYGKGLRKIIDRTIDWVGSVNIKVMLCNASFSFSADHEFVSDIVANEISGTGYTGGHNGAGRKALASKTITDDTGNDRIELDAADPSAWTGLNAGTVAWVVVFEQGASDAASQLIGVLDPADLVTNGGDVTLSFNAEGIFQISYA